MDGEDDGMEDDPVIREVNDERRDSRMSDGSVNKGNKSDEGEYFGGDCKDLVNVMSHSSNKLMPGMRG